MGISWKDLEQLEKKNHELYERGKAQELNWGDICQSQSNLTWAEVARLLYCARKYKELLKADKKAKANQNA